MTQRRYSVLLVDDDPNQRVFVTDLLKAGSVVSCQLEWTPHTDEALALLAEDRFDAALIDYQIDHATGIDVVREARRSGCDIPLIMLTGHRSRQLDLEAMRAGADDFLDKGILTAELLDRVLRYTVQAAETRRRMRGREEYFRALIQHASDAILLLDRQGHVLFASDSVEQLTGLAPGAVIGDSAFARIHAGDVEEVRLRFTECVDTPGGPVTVAHRARHADSRWVDREFVMVNRLDHRSVGAVVVNYRDITARGQDEAQRAQLALAESEREYRTIFEDSPVGLAHATLAGKFTRCNRRLLGMLGYTAEELRSLTFVDVTHEDDRDADIPGAESAVTGRTFADVEKRYRRKDGTFIWCRTHATVHRDSEGVPQYWLAAVEDISGRRAMDERLQSALGRLQAIVRHLPMSLWTLDTAGTITFADGLLRPWFSACPGELVGRSQWDICRNDPEALAATRRALAGEPVHAVLEEATGTFETWYSPMHDHAGVFIGTIGICVDITDRLKLEQQLRQSQKLEAVGLLAGGVAHDFNNLLSAIMGFAELALVREPEGPVYDDLRQIHQAGQSAAALTRHLLAFSHQQVLRPQHVAINTIVCNVEGLLRRVIGEHIQVRTQLTSGWSTVHADPVQIEQILMNLAVNARDAMPGGGQLTIETGQFVVDAAYAAAHQCTSLGPHVVLTVSDTGVGMDAATRKRLFEPFFTTKELGRGTGLGLATVDGIVKQSGGSIWVYSEPGLGTTFKVLLPAVGVTECDAQIPQRAGVARGRETVMVVDDQAEVRAIAREILRRHGYTVHEASCPSEALAFIEQQPADLRLVLTDMVMPEMTGRDLALRITSLLPETRIVYTSGYTEEAIGDQSVLAAPGVAFLPKPFTTGTLLRKIREVLDASLQPVV